MPYLIETFSPSIDGSKLLLRNIDTANIFEDKQAANDYIEILKKEQAADNQNLMDWYTDQLRAQVLDESTEDKILREPKLYNYTFKAAKYSKAAIKRIP